MSTDTSDALVLWTSTGRRVQFSKEDLAMPERVKALSNFSFYEKQWEAVSAFWFNRVMKETSLQTLTVAAVIDLIEKDIDKRWQARRAEQAIYKKKKRLLSAGDGAPAGPPSESVVITNICSLPSYHDMSEYDRKELVSSVVDRVQTVSKTTAVGIQVLEDSSDAATEPPAKRPKGEEDASDAPPFDDRVAVVVSLGSKDKAALTIAHLHGSRMDGRTVLCRFWS